MRFTPSGGQTARGPAAWFTGDVYIEAVRNPDGRLYVTDGIGLVATRAGVQEIRPGDVVYVEPDEEHWHGATPDRLMAHVAMQEADDQGEVATWGEQVTDTEYAAR